jgi:hypothetical protein
LKKNLTPMKAIRAKCIDCSAGSYREVKLCPIEDCSLYPYRMGHRPTKSQKDATRGHSFTQKEV